MFVVSKKPKILMALSGGVDSSVALALLVRQGYEVTAAFMVNYDDKSNDVVSTSDESCWVSEYRDALRVSARLGVSLIKLDFREVYQKQVLEHVYREYERGNTPNPDIWCNQYVKYGAWLDMARERNFDVLATGHYAIVKKKGFGSAIRYQLHIPRDMHKDQTYFLHRLNQKQLSHAMFPIGRYTKDEVRAMAIDMDLPTAHKEESMGICFVGEVPIKDFLKNKIQTSSGLVRTTSGDIIGTHEGLAVYTIGQRHGFAQKGGERPWYVVAKNMDTHELIVGHENDPRLYTVRIVLDDVHWISGNPPADGLKCFLRVRHGQTPVPARVEIDTQGEVAIVCDAPIRAVAPGQSAVIYRGTDCLGGGIIR